MKPRLTSEDYSICALGLEALVKEEEAKEIEFAQKHIIVGDDTAFRGTYNDLCELYAGYDRPTGSVMRTKAMSLMGKVLACK